MNWMFCRSLRDFGISKKEKSVIKSPAGRCHFPRMLVHQVLRIFRTPWWPEERQPNEAAVALALSGRRCNRFSRVIFLSPKAAAAAAASFCVVKTESGWWIYEQRERANVWRYGRRRSESAPSLFVVHECWSENASTAKWGLKRGLSDFAGTGWRTNGRGVIACTTLDVYDDDDDGGSGGCSSVNHESKEFPFASLGLMLDLIIRRRRRRCRRRKMWNFVRLKWGIRLS